MEKEICGLKFEYIASLGEDEYYEHEIILGKLQNGKLFVVEIFYPYEQQVEPGIVNIKLEDFVKNINLYYELNEDRKCIFEQDEVLINADELEEKEKQRLIYEDNFVISYKETEEKINEYAFEIEEFTEEFLKQHMEIVDYVPTKKSNSGKTLKATEPPEAFEMADLDMCKSRKCNDVIDIRVDWLKVTLSEKTVKEIYFENVYELMEFYPNEIKRTFCVLIEYKITEKSIPLIAKIMAKHNETQEFVRWQMEFATKLQLNKTIKFRKLKQNNKTVNFSDVVKIKKIGG